MLGARGGKWGGRGEAGRVHMMKKGNLLTILEAAAAAYSEVRGAAQAHGEGHGTRGGTTRGHSDRQK